MGKFNFEAVCSNCHHKFKYGSGYIVIECGFKGVRCPKCWNWIYHSDDNTPNYLELYIARDKNGYLCGYDKEPLKDETDGFFFAGSTNTIEVAFDTTIFPQVTWDNSPRKVKIELVEMTEENKEFDNMTKEEKNRWCSKCQCEAGCNLCGGDC